MYLCTRFCLDTDILYAGETRQRVFDEPAELGARELRIPEEQDKEVQRSPGAPDTRVVQVPAADPEQGSREPAQPVLRELPERLVRPQRLHGVRPRRRGDRHVPQDQDREAVQPAQPDRGRREQGVGVLHADGEVAQLAAQLAGAAAGGHPHQHDRARPAAAAGHDPAAAVRAAHAAGLALAHHVQGRAALPRVRRGGVQAVQRAAAGPLGGGAAAARPAARECELPRAARGERVGERVGARAGEERAARASAGAAGGGAGQAGVPGRARALVVPAADARVQGVRGVGAAPAPRPPRARVRVTCVGARTSK